MKTPPKKIIKTTKEDFKYFVSRCIYWQKQFGLQDWEINFYHMKIDPVAHTKYQFVARKAHITLSTERGEYDPVNEDELNMTAAHECLHIVLSNTFSALQWNWSEDRLNEEEHAIIQRIINAFVRR